jgi:hypothetical protein
MIAIPLVGKRGLGHFVQIDDADASIVAAHRWRLHSFGYATTVIKGADAKWHTVTMHRLIMGLPHLGVAGAPRDGVVDHIDGNPLNNQRINLRVVTQSENRRNAHNDPLGASGVRGVYPRGDGFVCRWIDGPHRRGKRFSTVAEAAEFVAQRGVK